MHGPCERLRTQRHGRADGGVCTLRHSSETLPSLDQFQVNNKAEGVWLARGYLRLEGTPGEQGGGPEVAGAPRCLDNVWANTVRGPSESKLCCLRALVEAGIAQREMKQHTNVINTE